jgi:hypothetical protein
VCATVWAFNLYAPIIPYKPIWAGVGAYNGGMLIQPYLKHFIACNEAVGSSGFFFFLHSPDHSGAAKAFFLPTRKPFDYKLRL